jgi:hypothetical protein
MVLGARDQHVGTRVGEVMTKYSTQPSQGLGRPGERTGEPVLPPAQRDGNACDLYAPGHQIHYKHQGQAVRSPAVQVAELRVDGSLVVVHLEDGRELRWRHHDPDRLSRILELLRGTCTAYPVHHALRVGPYWFNCASETDPWHECRTSRSPSHA